MLKQTSPNICPVCKEVSNFNFIKNHTAENQNFSLFECLSCRVQFWEPFKNPGNEWYKSKKKEKRENPIVYRGYHKKFLKLYKTISPKTSVLDIGCGRGELLNELQKRGCDCWGVDFNESVIDVAKNYFNLKNVFVANINNFFDNNTINFPKFDIITSFEVIEHLDDPSFFIKGIVKMLEPNGLIIVSAPSRERLFVDSYDWDFPPHHLSRWNEKAFVNFFHKNGLKIISIHYTDSFFHLKELFFKKTQFGLMKKVATEKNDMNKNIKENTADIVVFKKRLKSSIIVFLIKLKNAFLIVVPVVFILFFSKIFRIKNGVMVIRLKKN